MENNKCDGCGNEFKNMEGTKINSHNNEGEKTHNTKILCDTCLNDHKHNPNEEMLHN